MSKPSPYAETINRLRGGVFTPAEIASLHAMTSIILAKRGHLAVIESRTHEQAKR